MAERIKGSRRSIHDHWSLFTRMLGGRLARGASYDPAGYSYYLRGRVDVTRRGSAFIAGDAAGLATRDMAEGIGPAVRSGIGAAEAILHGKEYRLDDVTGASLGGGLASRLLDWAMTRGAGRAAPQAALPA
jgi:flavin-dependent dehydrogenase